MRIPDMVHDLPIRKIAVCVLGATILHEAPTVRLILGMPVAIIFPHTLVVL